MFEKTQALIATILLITMLIKILAAVTLINPKVVKSVRYDEVDYDRYLLATSWAGTTCKFHDCSHYGSDEVFNLHGLWPSTAGQSPQDCGTINFKEQNLSPYLKHNLYIFWNSFYHDNWEFLDHEITKHGSCWRPDYGDFNVMDRKLVDIIQTYDSSDDYSKINTFLTLTISLSQMINPYKALKEQSIIPSETTAYNVEDILAVFKNLHGIKNSVMPVCLAEKSSGALYLAELRFCLDINFMPIECNPGEMNRQLKRCRESSLTYPLFPRP